MLKKILWDQQNPRQIWGAIIGTFLGLFLLFSSVQLYRDIRSLTQGKENREAYVLINKKVNIFNTLGASSAFTNKEIETLKSQRFVQSVGQFTPNRYKVSVSSPMMGFYTELFFESIESDYLDIDNRKFHWKEGQAEIPIVLSRDYLALYNFGFAPSQGLPQFTPNTIKKVSVDVNIRGNGLRKTLSGRIVDFSDRINSILVPQSFMDWANKTFGDTEEGSVSRLILATDEPYNQELHRFLKNNNYEVSKGKLIGGQIGVVIHIILGLIAFIGLIITLLSVLVFILNFELIISRSSDKIQLLLQLGYKTEQISKLLIQQLLKIFAIVLIIALLSIFIGHYFLAKWMLNQSMDVASGLHWSVYLVALLVAGIFAMVNIQNIQKKVARLFQ